MSKQLARNKDGTFAKGGEHGINHENAMQMQEKAVNSRRESQQEANDSAMLLSMQHKNPDEHLKTPEQAAAYLVAVQADRASDPILPGTTAAARFVMQETGRSQERQTFQAGKVQGAVDMAALLVAALGVERDTRAVDAEWKQVTETAPDTEQT